MILLSHYLESSGNKRGTLTTAVFPHGPYLPPSEKQLKTSASDSAPMQADTKTSQNVKLFL